jgi:hypothetical protein
MEVEVLGAAETLVCVRPGPDIEAMLDSQDK